MTPTLRSHNNSRCTHLQTTPTGKVFKGKKMPGRMGTDRVTVQMQRVMKIDRGRDLIYVRGQVPGQRGGWVRVSDACKGNKLGQELCDKVNEVNGGEVYDGVPYPIFKREEGVDGCGMPGFELLAPAVEENPIVYGGGPMN